MEQLTYQNILKYVTQEQIFEELIFEGREIVDNNRVYTNPLRDDRNPTCHFYTTDNGRLLFMDRAAKELSGSCFDMIKVKYRVTFYEACRIIARHFKLPLDSGYLEGYEPDLTRNKIKSYYVIPALNRNEKKETEIKIVIKDYSIRDLNWWKRYGITKSILKRYRVYPIEACWIRKDNNSFLYHVYTYGDPMYAYIVNKHNKPPKIKIYRPLASSKNKWRTNCNVEDLQGYTQLPKKGNSLIITSSLKDVMSLKSLGYIAVAPNNEGSIIPDYLIEDSNNRFENIFILYDNDEAGIKTSVKMSELINATNIILPSNLPKDPSDIIKNNKTDELLCILDSYGVKKYI